MAQLKAYLNPMAITGIAVSTNTFTGGGADGTVVGAITISGTNNSAARLTITGPDAARFRLSSASVPSNLLLNGTQAGGTYSINLVATLSGATGSPFTQPETITGTSLPPGFFVATNGTNNSTCSISQPCTFSAAQTAMQHSATKLTYVRAGTYDAAMFKGPNACGASNGVAVTMTSADNGETFRYYTPEGVNTASITGDQNTPGVNSSSGVDQGFCVLGTGISIIGLHVHNFFGGSIVMGGGNNLATDNEIDHSMGGPGPIGMGDGNIVTHNYSHDNAGIGISFAQNNSTVAYNYLADDCSTTFNDCGQMYIYEGTSSGLTLYRNYIHDSNPSYGQVGHGIYLDGCHNGVVITQNIVTGLAYSGLFYNGGNNNVATGHVVDLGPQSRGAQAIITGQFENCNTSGMTGNSFARAIIIANSGNAGAGYGSNYGPSPVSTGPNLYHNYNGPDSPQIAHTGPSGNDSAPQNVDPKFLKCPGGGVDSWSYTLDPTSPAFSSPVNYPAQTANDRGIAWGMPGYWGPAGFTIPHTGTPPSYGPTC